MTYYQTQGGSPSADLIIYFAEALEAPVNVLIETESKRKRTSKVAPYNFRLWPPLSAS